MTGTWRLVGALCVACACSSSPEVPDASDAGNGSGDVVEAGPTYPANHPPMPNVVNAGGPVMKTPKVVVLTYDTDTLQSDIDDFSSKIGASSYWSGAVGEYGVGSLTAIPAHLTEAPPTGAITDADVQAWLTTQIQGGGDAGADAGPTLPAPDGNTLYAVYYPSGVNLTLMGFPSCSGFDGYHGDFAVGAGRATYAVLMRCGTLSDLTIAAAHEYTEAATDPLSESKPAYNAPDTDHTVWEYGGGGGELADMCSSFPGINVKPTDLGYTVPQIWSNANAAASHDPCQPFGTTPYFNSAPVLNDTVTVNDPMAGTFTTKCVHVPVGQSGTVELDLYSDAPTSGPWSIQVLDVASDIYGGTKELSFSLDNSTGQNGDVVHLTINALTAGQGGASAFWIQNTLGSSQTVWLGLVGN